MQNKKVLRDLKSFLKGEILSDANSIKHFSKDQGVFIKKPGLVLFPKNKGDLKNLMIYIFNLAKYGNVLEVVPRGRGNNGRGTAISQDLLVVLGNNFDKILEIGDDFVNVEAGVDFNFLNEKLKKDYGVFIPFNINTRKSLSVGGLVSQNIYGSNVIKYGSIQNYVKSLKLVLSNGEELKLESLDKFGLEKKLKLENSEGDIYRKIFKIYLQNRKFLGGFPDNIAGVYNIKNIDKFGLFNLAEILVGSNGTLGFITEVCFRTVSLPRYNVSTYCYIQDLTNIANIIRKSLKLDPSDIKIINETNSIKKMFSDKKSGNVILIEFNGDDANFIIEQIENCCQIFREYSSDVKIIYSKEEQNILSKHSIGDFSFCLDVVVKIDNFNEFIANLKKVYSKLNFSFSIGENIENLNIQVSPLAAQKSKDDIINIFSKVLKLAKNHGAYLGGNFGDGLILGVFLGEFLDKRFFKISQDIKKVFDPYLILNPYIKLKLSPNILYKFLSR